MMHAWKTAFTFAACLSWGAMSTAQAQETYAPTPADQQAVAVVRPPTVWEAFPFAIRLQGGVEGYTGSLASRLSPGGTYGAVLSADPSPFLGMEVGYSGAATNLKNATGNTNGPDLYRNGGYVAVTPGVTVPLTPTASAGIKPYVMGGVGIDTYTPEGDTRRFGYSAQTTGDVPFGAGLQLRSGAFVADARFNYAWEFGNSFTPVEANPLRYQGQISLGAAF